MMKVSLVSQSHEGYVRKNNEDMVAVCPDLQTLSWTDSESFLPLGPAGALAIVADGMGGANAGEVASNIAVARFKEDFSKKVLPLDSTDEEKCAFLRETIASANKDINDRVENDPDTIGMGTTLVVLWLQNEKAHIAWCGDCRCYWFSQTSGLKPLTKDHSYVQSLVDKGELKPEQVFGHPDSNLITRGIGDLDTDSTADSLTVQVLENGIFLLCSDGLCGYCNDNTIENIIRKNKNNCYVCKQKLLDAALEAGGYDNISLVLLSAIIESNSLKSSRLFNKIKQLFTKS